MEVSLQKTGELSRELVVTLSAAEVSKKVEERLTEIGRQAKIPGFRPGKIPANVLMQRYGQQVQEELRRDIVSETMPDAFSKEDVFPAGQPHVEFGELHKDKDYTYKVNFDVMPDFKPKKYTGLKLTKQVAKADAKQVDNAVERLQQSMRSFETKTGKAAKGDMAVISATGFDAKSKEALPGAVVEKHPVELGSGALIPGFEDQLVGHAAGEKFSIEVTFPKDYHAKELAGKKASFEIDLHEVKKSKLPELTDEFAQQFGTEGLTDLKGKIKDQLERDMADATRQRLKRDLFDKLEKDNDFALPASMVESEFNAIWGNFMQDMKRSGSSFEQMGQTEDEMRAEHRKLAERRVRLGLVLSEIGKLEDVKVDAKDVKSEIDQILATLPAEQAERARAYYNTDRGRQEIVGPLFENKVCDWIFENATVEEKQVEADKLMEELN